MNKEFVRDVLLSWNNRDGTVNKTSELLAWIQELNSTTFVRINECSINDSTFWFYDDYNGEIMNRKRSFFSIKGMRRFENGEFTGEQPIIVQPEIGYLGIICRKINGVLNFLMQAKIEPGNVNCVQISPTIQATKSNFTRAHGGRLPTYFEFFERAERFHVVYDQIQSEQAARFYKKRNRNMIMVVDEDFEIYPNFRWMTLGQIKTLMTYDNLVNMDTRTVLSGIPFIATQLDEHDKAEFADLFTDPALYRSMFESDPLETIPLINQRLNNYRMFRDVTVTSVPLNQLVDWKVDEFGVICKKQADYMVRYYDIEISGREVQHWSQPLIKAIGSATFGLLTCIDNGTRNFLVKIKPEIGSFDKAEIGPTVQWEPSHYLYDEDAVETLFRRKSESGKGVVIDVILSEEGGRFYHEQNKNVIIEIDKDEIDVLPDEYIWVSFATLNFLVQTSSCLNIQLRNLISLLNI